MHNQTQQTQWLGFHIFRDHPTLAGKTEYVWVAFQTSSLTATLPVGSEVSCSLLPLISSPVWQSG